MADRIVGKRGERNAAVRHGFSDFPKYLGAKVIILACLARLIDKLAATPIHFAGLYETDSLSLMNSDLDKLVNGLSIWRRYPYKKVKALYRDRVATVASGLLDRYEKKNAYGEGVVIEFARQNLQLARSGDGDVWLRIAECMGDMVSSETSDPDLRRRIIPDVIGICLLAGGLSGSAWSRFRLSWHLGLHGHAELAHGAVDAYEVSQCRAFAMITAFEAQDTVLSDIVPVNFGAVKRMVADIEGGAAARIDERNRRDGTRKYKGIRNRDEYLGLTGAESSKPDDTSEDDFMPGLKVIMDAYPSPPATPQNHRAMPVEGSKSSLPKTSGSISGTEIMDWLSLWRTEPYDDILANHKNGLSGISDGLIEAAEAKFGAPRATTSPSSLMLDWLGAARLLDAEAWLRLAETLPGHLAGVTDLDAPAEQSDVRGGKKTDIEGTCLLLSSAYGSRWARYMLSYHLAINGHTELARQAISLSEIEGVFTPYFVLRVNGGELPALPEFVTENQADIQVYIRQSLLRKLEEQEEAPPKVDWDKVQPQEPKVKPSGTGRSAARYPATDPALRDARDDPSEKHEGPFAWVLRGPIPLPPDRDYRKLVEDANRILVKVPLRAAPDPGEVSETLIAEFPWMSGAIEAVRGHLVLARRLGGTLTLPPTVLVGPPGCGKSRFARRLAETLNLPHVRISCAGMSDNRILAGTARGWSSQSPSLPVTMMMRYTVANAAIILDEVEKAGGTGRNGRIDLTLLSMIEKETARDFFDEGLSAKIDVSRINWLFTANDRMKISPLLRSRMDFIEVGQPRPHDFDVILAGILWDIAQEYDVLLEELPDLDGMVISEMRDGFRAGRLSARQLKKLVRTALVAAADADRNLPRH